MPGNLSHRSLVGEAARRSAMAKANAGILLTQSEAAALLGIAPQTVHAIEARALAKIRAHLHQDEKPRRRR